MLPELYQEAKNMEGHLMTIDFCDSLILNHCPISSGAKLSKMSKFLFCFLTKMIPCSTYKCENLSL